MGIPVAFAGIVVRAWAAEHLEKNLQLAMSGPYAFVRNPLYVGTLLAALGFAIAAGSNRGTDSEVPDRLGRQFLFVLTVTGLMLTADVFNTAVEALCDHLKPDYHSGIKTIKDIAAAGAIIAILLWYAVIAVVLYEVAVSTELFTSAAAR